MTLHLVAITDDATASRVLAGREPLFAGCVAVTFDGLAALLSPPMKASWFERERTALIKRLERDQKRLEALLRHGPVLPATGQATLRDEHAARALLASAADTLRALLHSHGGLVQFQIRAELEPASFLAAHADDPALVGALTGQDDKEAAVRAYLEAQRAALAARAREAVGAAARDVVVLPVDGPETVFNLVALIAREGEAALDAAVAAVDASARGALTIRYTGPLPPVSFAGVSVEDPEDQHLDAASRLLGVTLDASAEAVRAAYHARAKDAHPDANPDRLPAAEMADLTEAYKLLTRVAKARQASGGDVTPLVRIRREGDITRAA